MTKNSTESNAGLKNSKITVNPDTFKATEIDANNSDLQNQGINIDNNSFFCKTPWSLGNQQGFNEYINNSKSATNQMKTLLRLNSLLGIKRRKF